ncbi:hypothetical protein D9M68_733000 [compost metagenome]
MLEVVDQQIQLPADPLRLAGHQGDQRIQRRIAAVGVQHLALGLQTKALQGRQQVGKEAGQLFVVHAQGQPGHIHAGLHQLLPPLRQQDRLAEAGTAGDQRDVAVLAFAQPGQQVQAGNVPRIEARRRELGRDEQVVGIHDSRLHGFFSPPRVCLERWFRPFRAALPDRPGASSYRRSGSRPVRKGGGAPAIPWRNVGFDRV